MDGIYFLVIWVFSVKFIFSKKATKIDQIFTVDLTLSSKCGENFVNFCGLLRKQELQWKIIINLGTWVGKIDITEVWYLHHEEKIAKYRVVGLNYKSPFIYTVHILHTKLVWVGCLLLNALKSIEISFLLLKLVV